MHKSGSDPLDVLKPITLAQMGKPGVRTRSIMNKVHNRQRGMITDTIKILPKPVHDQNPEEKSDMPQTKIVNKRGRRSIQKTKQRRLELNHTNFFSLYKECRNNAVKAVEDLPKMKKQLADLEAKYDLELRTPRMVGKELVYTSTPGLYMQITELRDKIAHAINNTPDLFTLKTSHHLQMYIEELDKMSVVEASVVTCEQPLPTRCLVKIHPPIKRNPKKSLASPTLSSFVEFGTDNEDSDQEDCVDSLDIEEDVMEGDEVDSASTEGEVGINLEDSTSGNSYCYVFFVMLDDDNPNFVMQHNEALAFLNHLTMDKLKKSIIATPELFLTPAMVTKLPKPFHFIDIKGAPIYKKVSLTQLCASEDLGFDMDRPLPIIISKQVSLHRILIQYSLDMATEEDTNSLFRKSAQNNQLGSIMNAMLKDVCNEQLDSAQNVESKELGTAHCTNSSCKGKSKQLLIRDEARAELICPKCGVSKNDMDNGKTNVVFGEHRIKTCTSNDTKLRNFSQILRELQVFFILYSLLKSHANFSLIFWGASYWHPLLSHWPLCLG
jgi:hypothetical protein